MIAACALLAVFGALLGHAVLEALRERRRDWREWDACERIGHDQVRGCVERLTMAELQERKR